MSEQPTFQSEFLRDLNEAFRKRRRAISHQAASVRYGKIYELIDDEKVERFEAELEGGNPSATFRLHAWPDRILWVDFRQSAKSGRGWEWTSTGRLLPPHSGREVVAAIEQTYSHVWSMTRTQYSEFEAIWRPMIAKGPTPV